MADSSTAPAAPPGPPPLSRGQTFLRRLFSSVVLWTVVLLALFADRLIADYCFLLIMFLLSGAGLIEFYDLARKIGLPCYKRLGIIGGLLLMTATFFYASGRMGKAPDPAQANDFETSFLILFVLGLCVRQFLSKSNPHAIAGIGATLLGLMYIPWLLNFIQKLNFYPGIEGSFYVLHFILVTKFSDLGAYVTGSLIGRHKMIPRISPGKTWEGFGGAVVISTLASVGYYYAAQAHLAPMTLAHAIILGIVLSSTAVIGDLIESIFKREAGVKDSGRLFPGIGGILDLMDSLLFNAPLMYLYVRHILM